jgi:hypothetical protein
MFILHPIIGPFSPLNREFLLKSGVAGDIRTIDEAINFGDTLKKSVSDKTLLEMAQKGFGKHHLDGFKSIADHLVYNHPGKSK